MNPMQPAQTEMAKEVSESWPKVAIIILNWNNWRDTIECLESFQAMIYPNYKIIVVDNGSTDDSVQQIKTKFPYLTLLETGINLGYTGGNNIGIKYALEHGAEYILIVNNDTQLLNPHLLTILIKVMKTDDTIGIIGPKVVNPHGEVQDTILFTPTLFNCIKESLCLRLKAVRVKAYNSSQPVEAVSGVCWLVRADVVRNVGFLDEDYFMYVEEQDYCYRARKCGWKVVYYPIESVLHKKGSQDTNKNRMFRQYIYTRRNIVLFLCKHYNCVQAIILATLFIISTCFKIVISMLSQRNEEFYNVALLFALLREIKGVLWKGKTHDQSQ